MVTWNSSPHPISDIRDWSELGRLELRPAFQRMEVWSEAAQIMLMDTILRGVPMPKVFLATEIRAGKTHRIVIDGQQRLTAILAFLRDEFALGAPYDGPLAGKRFSEFTEDEANAFLSYKIDFNEAVNPSDKEAREVYARVNKYTVPLNKQELRRADYPGDFLNVSEDLAVHPYLEDAKIFLPGQRRRYLDVEYVSEILAAMLNGIQDKKGDLDDLYRDLATWEPSEKTKTTDEFEAVIGQMEKIFEKMPIAQTRFKQKADFYSLFLVIHELHREGGTVNGKDLEPLRGDLQMLHHNIEPESHIRLLSEYAIKCVSQANSAASRRWRHGLLRNVLEGTFHSRRPTHEATSIFVGILSDANIGNGFSKPAEVDCAICDERVDPDLGDARIFWPPGEQCFQMSNSCFVHAEDCSDRAIASKFTEATPAHDDRQQDLF